MATYRWMWRFPLEPARLWPEVSNTDRFNARSGLPPVTYVYEPLTTGGSRTTASIAIGPFAVRWIEPPWDWNENGYYRVDRRYLGGPLARFSTTLRLVPEAGGTRVEMTVELTARNLFGAIVIPLLAFVGHAGATRAMNAAAAAAAATSPPLEAVPAVAAERTTSAPAGNHVIPALERARATLVERGFAPDLVERFVEHLATADDVDLATMRPFTFADDWHADRNTVLRLFLSATRAGVLNLSWDVLCPGCRAPKGAVAALSSLRDTVHCEACNVSFGPQFDRSVEVTFNAGPLGKGVDVPVFCRAGPHNTPHIVAQRTIAPRERAELSVPLEAGHYVAHALGINAVPFAGTRGEGSVRLSARITDGGIENLPEEVPIGLLDVDVESVASRETVFQIIKTDWPDTITTAAQVTALQDFRDLFSSEVLATGLELSVQSITVLFTDLVGSTELYNTTGDAPAFRIVHDHFAEMRAVIATHNGAIVKTIGDAVMAVFVDPGDAFAAAIRLPRAVGKVRTESGPLMLRVGLHNGPCIAMQANDKLDYFGTTVNLAARIQHAASGGEVLMSALCAEFPAVAAQLAGFPAPPQSEVLAFKGFARDVPVVRVKALAS